MGRWPGLVVLSAILMVPACSDGGGTTAAGTTSSSAGGRDTSASADQDHEATAPLDSTEGFRRSSAGFALTDSSLLVGGGLLDRDGEFIADSFVVEASPDGVIQRRFEIPLEQGEFLDVRSIEAFDDGVRIFGVRCQISSADTPGCALAGRVVTVVRVGADGTSSSLDIAGVLPREHSTDQVGLRLLDISGEIATVARYGIVQAAEMRPSTDIEFLSVDLSSGDVTSLGHPSGAVGNPESVCMSDGQILAVVLSSGPADTGERAPSLEAARVSSTGSLEWRSLGELPVEGGQVPPAAICGPSSTAIVSGTEPDGVTAAFVQVDSGGLRSTQQLMRLRAWYAYGAGDELIVTELAAGLVGVWRVDLHTGAWTSVGEATRPDSELPYIVPFGDRLIDVGPALASPTPADALELREVGR